MLLMWSMRGLVGGTALLLFIWACADRRQVHVWSMPSAPQQGAEVEHRRARHQPQPYPWPRAGGPEALPGDAAQRDPRMRAMPRGDLPETGLRPPDAFWRLDERAAYREARELRRGVLIDFSASWCFPCVKLDRDTLADPLVRQTLSASFIPLKVDVTEESLTNREQIERYRVYRLPAVLLLDAQGRELDRIGEYIDASHFLARLSLAERKLEAPIAEVAKSEADGTPDKQP